jgi:carboxyl-terminal processing protease
VRPENRRRLFIGAFVVLLFIAGWVVGWSRATAVDRYDDVHLFVQVLQRVDQYYVDPVEPKKLVDGAIQGMLRRLDPFSSYLDEKALVDLTAATQGQFGGLGIVVGIRDNYPTVISPLEGTPAFSIGIQSGDRIVEIDAKPTRGLAIDEVVSRLRGPEGTKVTVRVSREGEEEPRTYTITREIITVKSVPYAHVFSGGIGYVRLASFSSTTGDELRQALAALDRDGAKSLILDLRRNPGGLLSEAVDVAEQFLPKGEVIVETRGRMSDADQTYAASFTQPHLSQPLVVLVDEASASAAEIVAGALQDHDRALLVGEPTFGKGSVQSVINLPGSRAALKLTTAKYYTPSGRSIHKDAFEPHADAPAGDEDEVSVTPAKPDSAPKPKFRTDAGRTVFGGGGIQPDLVVKADTLIDPSAEIERRGLPFTFAVRYVAKHPNQGEQLTVTPEVWNQFLALLGEEKLEYVPAALDAQRPYVETALRREVGRRVGGDDAAFRAAAGEDQVLQRALDLLRKSRSPKDLLRVSMIH